MTSVAMSAVMSKDIFTEQDEPIMNPTTTGNGELPVQNFQSASISVKASEHKHRVGILTTIPMSPKPKSMHYPTLIGTQCTIGRVII